MDPRSVAEAAQKLMSSGGCDDAARLIDAFDDWSNLPTYLLWIRSEAARVAEDLELAAQLAALAHEGEPSSCGLAFQRLRIAVAAHDDITTKDLWIRFEGTLLPQGQVSPDIDSPGARKLLGDIAFRYKSPYPHPQLHDESWWNALVRDLAAQDRLDEAAAVLEDWQNYVPVVTWQRKEAECDLLLADSRPKQAIEALRESLRLEGAPEKLVDRLLEESRRHLGDRAYVDDYYRLSASKELNSWVQGSETHRRKVALLSQQDLPVRAQPSAFPSQGGGLLCLPTGIQAEIIDSPFFDADYYRSQRPDAPAQPVKAWEHYLAHGWRNGQSPSLYLDVGHYLDNHADVDTEGVEPLYHWFTQGRHEQRFPVNPYRVGSQPSSRRPYRVPAEFPGITICIPVFNATESAQRCLDAAMATSFDEGLDVRIHVHDDGSSDPRIGPLLSSLDPTRAFVTTSIANRGFTATANDLMASHQDRDVVLLNSDTVVFPGWISRLATAAYSGSRVGSVTALSNNAAIASFPDWPEGGSIPVKAAAEFAHHLASISVSALGGYPLLPTAVGSCMYLRRDALDEVGKFDERRFPRGYGEENDWSLRAQRLGWLNVLAPDVYVYHEGRASFGKESQLFRDQGATTLLDLYPDYGKGIAAWLKATQLPDLFRAQHFLRMRIPRSLASVHVLHSLGGETDQFVRLQAKTDSREIGHPSLVIRCTGDRGRLEVVEGGDDTAESSRDIDFDLGELPDLLAGVHVVSTSVIVHDDTVLTPELVERMQTAGLSLNLWIHDG